MTTYIIRRILQALMVLIIVTMILFVTMRLLPGDPILLYVSDDLTEEASEAQIQLLRKEFGLDKPIALQYVEWVFGVFRGDLGKSIRTHRDVGAEIAKRIPITFHLGIVAFIISIIVGIPAGIICAVKRGTSLDTAVTTLANLGITMPIFWLGILLIYLFGLHLRWLPIYGYTSPFDNLILSTRQVIMPIFCLAIVATASGARMTRSSMLEVLRQDYIRTAWSKGLRERSVILRHALKNSLIPVITLMGIGVGFIFAGSVLIETIFAIPGVGRLLVSSIFAQDYMVIQSGTLVIATIIVLSNLIVDISYGWLDPRIRYG